MRWLILNEDYPGFLEWLYGEQPGLRTQSYEEQLHTRNRSLFGQADFYSRNLRQLGHEAWEIHFNNAPLQRAWAREHGIRVRDWRWAGRLRRGFVPWIDRTPDLDWPYRVLEAQIRHYRPDILLSHAVGSIPAGEIRRMAPGLRLLVGQHAATALPGDLDYGQYDLALSSFPPTVEFLAARGAPARLFRLGFEPAVLDHLGEATEEWDLTFAGSFFAVHESRRRVLESVIEQFPRFRVFGPDQIPVESPLRAGYAGPAWGREMYRVLRGSRITLNHHGDVPPYANNMRLYEATGVGTLLMTDWKENLSEVFEPGREVAAYRNPEECVELIRHYLAHEEERRAVARAGRDRTLREHTYLHRMEELIEITRPLLS